MLKLVDAFLEFLNCRLPIYRIVYDRDSDAYFIQELDHWLSRWKNTRKVCPNSFGTFQKAFSQMCVLIRARNIKSKKAKHEIDVEWSE